MWHLVPVYPRQLRSLRPSARFSARIFLGTASAGETAMAAATAMLQTIEDISDDDDDPMQGTAQDTSAHGAFQALLSAAESAAEDQDQEDDEDSDVPAITAVPGDGLADVDVFEATDDVKEYENLESGSEEEGELFFDQQDVIDMYERNLRTAQVADDDDDDAPAAIDEAYMNYLGGHINVSNGDFSAEKIRNIQWAPKSSAFEPDGTPSYPGLSTDVAEPIGELAGIVYSESPLAIFLYFMPRYLWCEIAEESSRYHVQQVPSRVEELMEAQRQRRRRNPSFVPQSRAEITQRLKRDKAIEPQEVTTMLGLLIARVICPQQRSTADHWAMGAEGAVPAGTFNRFMARDRFMHILRNLHFVDNSVPLARRDKCWKLRRVITVLQKRFLAGWRVGPHISFDEGVIPGHSKMNPTRSFDPSKPHKWGTKMFIACDTTTAYVYR